ncbi:hypothetical protein E2C01_096621 [Portunus trituberculatus]|uniref:Uncharacterized protein n=1 Tax=Portunus trituberculatus TaxID=210409 RepID=A0A5B7K7Q3_PORTR|nr:hypothetical protein [Portunus trituberculatus]
MLENDPNAWNTVTTMYVYAPCALSYVKGQDAPSTTTTTTTITTTNHHHYYHHQPSQPSNPTPPS